MGGITQTYVQLFVKSVRPAPWLALLCQAPWVPFVPPLQLFFLGHGGDISGSLHTLQPSSRTSPPNSAGVGGFSDRLSLEGLDLELWCLSLNLPSHFLGAYPPGQSTSLSLLRDPGAPASCLHTIRDG